MNNNQKSQKSPTISIQLLRPKMDTPHVGLQRVPLKDLAPEMDHVLIVAMIIGKQTPRKFPDRNKDNDQYRAVWNLTLRDSPRDYINVTYWGPSEEVCAANDKFYVGDVVEVRNPRINIRKFNEASELYVPLVTSPFSLNLIDHNQIVNHHGDIFSFSKLLNFPTKPLSGFVPLRDIHNEGANMKDRSIDILGAVRNVTPIKMIRTKTGQDMQLREVVLFDHTSSGLRVSTWDVDMMTRASNWKSRNTILFITDAKVIYNNFLKTYTASITGRSIVTENPIGHEAMMLATYAKSAPLEHIDILEQCITDLPDPETIQNVMCVQQVRNKVNSLVQEGQFTALMFVFVTHLDLDGPTPLTRARCSSCRGFLRNDSPVCSNTDCPVVLGTTAARVDNSFDIKVNLSDHTGTLINCRLSGSVAEQILDCQVHEFLKMSNEQKAKLKWKYLMERCTVRIFVMNSNRFSPRISIVSCAKANPLEAAQRIPLC